MQQTNKYEKLGLKIGLEVHQQLDTNKLFIRTPSRLEEETNFGINRKLIPVKSELGKYDSTAIDAYNRNETFFYKGNSKNISLVEIDEEPPQPLDEEALTTILEIVLLFESKPVDTAIIMRKNVIDGSNTSAFQKTMLISIGGKINIDTKKIGIDTIVLEEDSCRPIKKEANNVYYNLDRLGIPLIELATKPEIKTPNETILTAKKIGEIFRLTGKTKRGKGTIRQDVNVSIREGNRCEIKGCQELELIGVVVEQEIERQLDLIKIKKELNEKIKNKENIFSEIKELTTIFENSECKFTKNKKVFGTKLKQLNGFLGKKVGTKRFGSELSEYAKTSGVTGLIHNDELPNYGINQEEKNKIRTTLNCEKEDGFIFIVSEKKEAIKAFDIIKKRILIAFEEIPKETRGMNEDGSSTYQRPISSEARMYPETDLLPKKISEERIKTIQKNLPKTLKEREHYYKKLGLSINHVEEMKLNNYARFFEELVNNGANPRVTSTLLLQTMNELRKENKKIYRINKQQIKEILLLEKENKLNKNDLKNVLNEIILGKTIKEIMSEKKENFNETKIIQTINKIIHDNKDLIKNKKMGAIGPLMGDLMKEDSTKNVDGKTLSDLLKKEIQKQL